MKVIIAGSRNLTNSHNLVKKACDDFQEKYGEISLVISGGATGLDTVGLDWATNCSVPTCIYFPEWGRLGKAAGPIRNERMAQAADGLVLIWDGESKGSANMKKNAEKYGLKILEVVV